MFRVLKNFSELQAFVQNELEREGRLRAQEGDAVFTAEAILGRNDVSQRNIAEMLNAWQKLDELDAKAGRLNPTELMFIPPSLAQQGEIQHDFAALNEMEW